MDLSEKIKKLRQTEGYTQKEFSKLLKIGYSSLTNYENGYREPHQILPKICQIFPQYTLWLMTGKTNGNDQIDPHMKQAQSNKTG